ncbi:MAG TPA: PA14 domain-containing protein [Tepidisphaeraceae bacterium]
MLLASSGLAGAYFNNVNLSGSAVATRIDKTVNFNWGGTPGVSGIGADNFSVRWTGQVNPRYTGLYTFLTNSDDGVRLFINGQKVIDNWTRHAPTLNSGTAVLTAGRKANVTMEFFESSGGATAQLMWQSKSQARQIIPESQLSTDATLPPPPDNPPPTNPPPTGGGSGDGLLGTYFDNMDFTAQKLTRVDPQVNFNWGYGSPAGSIQTDTFSARWTGQVQAQKSETYTFFTKSDDGARLSVNGKVLIDKLIPQGPTEFSGTIALAAGQKYAIQLDYFDRSGGAQVALSWASPSTAKQVIPKYQLFSGGVVTPPPPTQPPATPAGLAATALSSSQIRLNWQDVANETGYKLERSLDGANWAQIATPAAGATSYTDSGLSGNTKYFYRLRATNAAGDSAYTAAVNATTQNVVTPPPTGGKFQPDQVIQVRKETSFVGDNVYNASGDGQSRSAIGEFYPTIFQMRVYNDGDTADSFLVTGPKSDANWRITYYDSYTTGRNGGKSITDAVNGSGWNTGLLQPGQYREYRAEVLPLTAPGNSAKTFAFTARSGGDPSKSDVVEATVSNPEKRVVAWRRQNFEPGTTYLMTIQNQGNLPDQFTVNAALGSGAGSSWNVKFFDDQWDGNDVTAAVRSGGGWKTRVLQPWESQEFRVVFDYTDPNLPSVQLTAASVAKTDSRETMTVTVGKPEDKAIPSDVFPIGTWTQPMSSFDKWKSRGVNTLIEYQGDGATIEQWSQAARDRGMYYIRRPLADPSLDKGDPNLLAWALPDEPEITSKYPAATLKTWVDSWHAADPTRPIWVNFSGGWVLHWQGTLSASGYKPYQDLTDWDSSSIYPVTGWARPQEQPGLDAPGQSLDRLEKWSNGHPQFAVIESSDQELSWIQEEIPGPTPGQFRAEVWDSIIHGARGIIYFPESFQPGFKFDNTSPEVAAEMTTTDAKIQSIAAVLQTAIDPPIRGLQADAPLEGTWRVKDGKTYYVVLNFSDQTVTRSLTLQGIGAAASAVVLGEGRSVSLVNGSFSDAFEPYSVHVYQVDAASGAAAEAPDAAAQAAAAASAPFATAPVLKWATARKSDASAVDDLFAD